MIAAIVLAGGQSRRMGSPKLLLKHQGQTLLRQAIHKAQSVADEVFVVVGAYADLYSREAERAGARIIINSEWSEGLASSVRAGIAALDPAITSALIVLADQPFVTQEHLQTLIKTHFKTDAALVFSSYEGIRGAPTLVSSRLFPQVATLKGDRGLQALTHQVKHITEVALSDFFDVDTPEDVHRLSKKIN